MDIDFEHSQTPALVFITAYPILIQLIQPRHIGHIIAIAVIRHIPLPVIAIPGAMATHFFGLFFQF
ncbi:hypothetical protein D3C84_1138200 [compost metagenome]